MNLVLKIKIAFSAIFIFFTPSLFSQYFETGQDPSSIKWRQINTKHFRLVYDSCYEAQAQRLAAIMDYTDTLSGNSLYQKPEKVSVLIHNHSAISNGLVVWTPKRMELYPVPPQDIYPQDWFEQLSLHEWRHVSQISRTKRGFTAITNLLFGQQAQGSAIMFMHQWFLEGDAVTTETALTNSGRGREPSFEMGTRALILENKKPYSFKKAVLGSFRDYIPDPYELGYLMVAYNRSKYGVKLWENVLDYDGKKTFTLFPFYFALKQNTGLSRTKLYDLTFKELDSLWTSKSKEINYREIKTINLRTSNTYASYTNPCIYNDSIIIAEKSGIDDINRIVRIDMNTGLEKILFTPGPAVSNSLSIAGNNLVWSEIVHDIRWENRSYSVVRRLNLKTGKSKYVTKKTKYYSPVISTDSKIISAIETNIMGGNAIVLLSADDGKMISKFNSPGNSAIQTPSWDDSARNLVMTLVGKDGKSLVVLDTKSGIWNTIITPSYMNISEPHFFGKYILYKCGFSGIDNLYILNPGSHKSFQITSVKYGAFHPVVSANRQNIIFSNYTSHGFDIASIQIDSASWIPMDDVKNISLNLAEKVSAQEKEKFDPDKISHKTYPSKPYSKFTHLLYLHSWMPMYTNLINLGNFNGTVLPGYMLMSQNLHGTLVAYGGQGFYNRNIYSSIVISYKAVFPVFQIAATDINKATRTSIPGRDSTITDGAKFSVGSYIPFNFSRGKYALMIVPKVALIYTKRSVIDLTTLEKKTDLFRFAYSLSAARLYDVSIKDIFPKFGESVFIYFSHPQKDRNSATGNYSYWNTKIYFPGIFNHQGIKISYIQEFQEVKKLLLESNLLSPRGFNNSVNYDTSMFSKLAVASLDYVFPVIFPDIQILKFIYLKSIAGTIYFENAEGKLIVRQNSNNRYKNFTSAGLELTCNYHLFYFPIILNTGIRIAYKPKNNQWVSEFILKMNLDSYYNGY
jgi:hypothetical protein